MLRDRILFRFLNQSEELCVEKMIKQATEHAVRNTLIY